MKFILEAFEATFDSVFISDFRLTKPTGNIYEMVVAKDIKTFFIDILIMAMETDREAYKLANMEGCMFLSNPLFNRVFYGFYKNLVVNSASPMSCPIKVGSYLLRNQFNKTSLPQIHPKGNFTFNLKLKSNAYDNVMLHLKWIYRFAKA